MYWWCSPNSSYYWCLCLYLIYTNKTVMQHTSRVIIQSVKLFIVRCIASSEINLSCCLRWSWWHGDDWGTLLYAWLSMSILRAMMSMKLCSDCIFGEGWIDASWSTLTCTTWQDTTLRYSLYDDMTLRYSLYDDMTLLLYDVMTLRYSLCDDMTLRYSLYATV